MGNVIWVPALNPRDCTHQLVQEHPVYAHCPRVIIVWVFIILGLGVFWGGYFCFVLGRFVFCFACCLFCFDSVAWLAGS